MHRTDGTARQYFQQLVDLLLVLGKDVAYFRALERRSDLVGGRILIERHHDGAEAVCCAHRGIEPRPVIAEQGDMRAALQAARRGRNGDRGRFVSKLAPSHRPPDASGLFANGRPFAAFSGVLQQQLRKSVETRIPSCHFTRVSSMRRGCRRRTRCAPRQAHPQNAGLRRSAAPPTAHTDMQSCE